MVKGKTYDVRLFRLEIYAVLVLCLTSFVCQSFGQRCLLALRYPDPKQYLDPAL